MGIRQLIAQLHTVHDFDIRIKKLESIVAGHVGCNSTFYPIFSCVIKKSRELLQDVNCELERNSAVQSGVFASWPLDIERLVLLYV